MYVAAWCKIYTWYFPGRQQGLTINKSKEQEGIQITTQSP